jgi:hypothetical protein
MYYAEVKGVYRLENNDLGNPIFECFSYHIMNILKEYRIIYMNLSFVKGILKIEYIDINGEHHIDKDYPKGTPFSKFLKQSLKDSDIKGDVRKWMK